eukprot:COSAG02_NODE_1257_length_13569_cov_5.370676_2_plen_229_part_00
MVTCEILRRCGRPPARFISPACEGDGNNSSSGRGSCFCPGGSVCGPGKGRRAVSLVVASVARSPCWAAEAGSRLQDGAVCRLGDGCDAVLFCLCLCVPLGWRSAVRLTRGIVVALPALDPHPRALPLWAPRSHSERTQGDGLTQSRRGLRPLGVSYTVRVPVAVLTTVPYSVPVLFEKYAIRIDTVLYYPIFTIDSTITLYCVHVHDVFEYSTPYYELWYTLGAPTII